VDTKTSANEEITQETALDVTLDTTKNPAVLDVCEQDNTNHIHKNPSQQIIKWKLTSDASGGTFNSISGNPPGFKWIDAPPTGLFGTPQLIDGGKEITISDSHYDPTTEGEWSYQLNAVINGNPYSTGTVSISGNTTDPMIINK
jgi:hypothetical protein